MNSLSKKHLLIGLFTLHFIFMLVVAINYSFFMYNEVHRFSWAKWLIFGEPLGYFIIILGLIVKNKTTYFIAVLFLITNSLLIWFDQVGLVDLVYFFFLVFTLIMTVRFKKAVFLVY